MLSLSGCEVPAELMARWREMLVCEPTPFFIDDNLPLPEETLILSRKAFAEVGFDASFRDSYATYRVSRAAGRVAFLSSAEFDSLPSESQQALLAAQCEFNRGQAYPWELVAPFLEGCTGQAETRITTVTGEKYLVLDTAIWQQVRDDLKQAWLSHFVSTHNSSVCLSADLSEADWTELHCEPARAIAGTFPARSGANCFSTTLAAVTRNQDTARTIADFWLHQEAFLEGLERRGYRLLKDALQPDMRDIVLVWNDAQGKPQHACYLIGNGLVLNKNSQAWFTPRQILHPETVLNEWKDDPLNIVLYGHNR